MCHNISSHNREDTIQNAFDRESPTDGFVKRRRIRSGAIESLCATFVDTETCHRFIKDHDRVFAFGDLLLGRDANSLRYLKYFRATEALREKETAAK